MFIIFVNLFFEKRILLPPPSISFVSDENLLSWMSSLISSAVITSAKYFAATSIPNVFSFFKEKFSRIIIYKIERSEGKKRGTVLAE